MTLPVAADGETMHDLSGGGRIRTCDLELRRLSLCPLSYAPRGAGFVPAGGVSVWFWRGRS